jgi:hypothetical protein
MKKTLTKKKVAPVAPPAAELFAEPVKQDSGAPAALKAIEADELLCRNRRDAAMKEWEEKDRKLVIGDEVSEADERRAWMRYQESREVHAETLKSLATFDKGVSKERREGEKITVEEAKEIFAQLDLCGTLSLEAYIAAQAQSAALCDSPEAFMVAHAENIRAARNGAIDAAKRDGALPAWIVA